MKIGALVISVWSVGVSAVLVKSSDMWLLGVLLLVFGFYKANQVFAPTPPPFEGW